MSDDNDETVRVPAALVEALREAADSQRQARRVGSSHAADWALTKAARALVDAAERPDEGGPCSHRWRAFPPDGKRYGYWRCDECGKQNEGPMCLVTTKERGVYRDPDTSAVQYVAAPAPVGEPLCKCGPTPYPGTDAPMEDCPVHYPPPAPLSSPRRTRDEGTEDEAEAAWQAFMADNGIGEVRWWEREAFRTAYCQSMLDAADAIQALHPGEVKNSVIWLRARAARLAGEDDR